MAESDNTTGYIIAALVGGIIGWGIGGAGDGTSETATDRLQEELDESRRTHFITCDQAQQAALGAGFFEDEPGTTWFWNWWFTRCGYIEDAAP